MPENVTQEELIDSPEQAALEDANQEEDINLVPLVADILSKYESAKTARNDTEKRWADAYTNFRGYADNREKFLETEKSQAFIKITKTKTQASYGQVLEVLLSEGKLPISIEPTEKPIGIEETVHIDPRDPEGKRQQQSRLNVGFTGDDQEIEKGATFTSRIGSKIKQAFGVEGAKKGPADEKEERTLSPAEIQAAEMEKKIQDQLQETDAVSHLRKSTFEMVMLGTGILKGPAIHFKEYPNWNKEGEYVPVVRKRPKIEHVSCWNLYPDPEARTPDELDYIIEIHRMTKTALKALKKRPMFRKSAIDRAVETGPNYEDKWWESDLHEADSPKNENRFEVVEYWGIADRDFIEEELEEDIPEDFNEQDDFQINAWVCNGEILRLVLNPFKPVRIPYFIAHYEEDPYNFFGVGLPENMNDTQRLMNGFARLAIDNAVLAGNVMVEVDETNLVPGQDMSIYAGKIWRRQGGPPGQAIFATQFPNTAETNMRMFDRFRVLADESTGIPSFSHGQTGVSGVGRTAAGISMLLNAASLTTKTIIKNVDNDWLAPLGQALFAWNMQFDFDPDLVGDLEVKAKGTSSLMQKEVRTQRLLQFLQIASNPFFATQINFETLLREIAKAMDLDADKLILDPKKAATQAQLFASLANALGSRGGGQQASGVAGPEDQTGGGGQEIGVGGATLPQEAGFSGSPSQQQAQPQQQVTQNG